MSDITIIIIAIILVAIAIIGDWKFWMEGWKK